MASKRKLPEILGVEMSWADEKPVVASSQNLVEEMALEAARREEYRTTFRVDYAVFKADLEAARTAAEEIRGADMAHTAIDAGTPCEQRPLGIRIWLPRAQAKKVEQAVAAAGLVYRHKDRGGVFMIRLPVGGLRAQDAAVGVLTARGYQARGEKYLVQD